MGQGDGLPTPLPAAVGGVAAAVQAAQIGIFEWDLATGELYWDRRALELFGYDDGSFDHTIDSLFRRLHPDDVARVGEALQRAQDTCGEYEAEARVCLPDGTTRWIIGRGRAVPDEDGRAVRLVGAAFDATAARDGEVHVQRVLESMPSAFFFLDRRWRFTYVNAEAERVLSHPREKLLGGDLWELFPAAVGSDFERHYRHAMATGQQTRFEAHYPAPLDRWYEVRVWPSPDGLSVYFLDITAHYEAEERAARAAQRADLEARVSAELAETFDVELAVARLAQIVVPTLADWCVVSIVEADDGTGAVRRLRDIAPWLADVQPERRLRDIGWWHVDEDARPLVQRYATVRLSSLKDDSFLRRALASRTAVPVHGPDTTRRIQSVLNPGEARDLLSLLAPMSAAALPMRARGRTVGALSLFRGSGRDKLTAEDLALAEDVATRAALALDNARLYRQQRHLAEGFQRSLLTPPLPTDQVEVAVRYQPAAQAAEVGGDWYDVFHQPGGGTVAVIGDVTGHDVVAAATMSHIRTALRSIAVTTCAGPAQLLQQVDRAQRTLESSALATVVVARLEQADDHGGVRLRWSSAGHLPPMVIGADRSVAPLATGPSDAMLGVRPDVDRVETVRMLERGTTVVLYTDGLLERRGEHLRDGIARLEQTLAELAPLGLEELCDEVLRRMLPDRPGDDVALVAIRLRP